MSNTCGQVANGNYVSESSRRGSLVNKRAAQAGTAYCWLILLRNCIVRAGTEQTGLAYSAISDRHNLHGLCRHAAMCFSSSDLKSGGVPLSVQGGVLCCTRGAFRSRKRKPCRASPSVPRNLKTAKLTGYCEATPLSGGSHTESLLIPRCYYLPGCAHGWMFETIIRMLCYCTVRSKLR